MLRGRSCKQRSALCQRFKSTPRRRSINTSVPESTRLQSAFQKLGDEKANRVPVGPAWERDGGVCVIPAQLRTEPLEEAQLLAWQTSSQHAVRADVRLLVEAETRFR